MAAQQRIKKIIAATDFSTVADNAVAYAAHLAKAINAKLTLVYCYKMYSSTGLYAYGRDEVEVKMKKELEWVEGSLSTESEIDYQLLQGVPHEAIKTLAEHSEDGYDLIVMGTQGENNLRRRLLGNTTKKLIEHTSVPVLAIPPESKFTPFENVICPVDEDAYENIGAVDNLAALIGMFSPHIHIYHFITEKNVRVMEQWETVDHISLYYEINSGELADNIIRFAEKRQANLICMFRKKRGLFATLLHESATAKQMEMTKIPLLILSV
ncbi:MAG: universal stress protein [Saprospiraceae bacterium]